MNISKNIILTVYIVLFTLLVTMNAWGHASKTFQDMDTLRALVCENHKETVSGGIITQELYDTLHRTHFSKQADEIEVSCQPELYQWDKENQVIVLTTLLVSPNKIGGIEEKQRALSLGIIRKNTLTSYTKKSYLLEEPAVGTTRFSRLNLAPYQINESDIAVGTIIEQHFMYAGGGGLNEYLVLFLIKNDNLIPILKTLINSQGFFAGDWNKDGTRKHLEKKSQGQLLILPHKTKGFFDLKKTSTHGKTMYYYWNGKEYQTTDLDSVTNVNQ